MNNSLQSRRERYFKLSTHLSQLDTKTLTSLLAQRKGRGWGDHRVLSIGGSRVFVKKLPITEVEQANQFSTRNLHRLPPYYNYGVGSAGFGAFREIISHIKTTNWVLDGAIENFPLMYHYRIVPTRSSGSGLRRENLARYVRYWNGSKRIGQYMEARWKAKQEAYLFLEYVPHVLFSWLPKNPSKIASVVEQMCRVHAFLRGQGIIHFDSHHDNIVTDGKQVYLTDFGLVLDRSFDLSKAEQTLFRENRFYDCGEFLHFFIHYVHATYDRLKKSTKQELKQLYGPDLERSAQHLRRILWHNLGEICERGWIQLPASHVEIVVKYREPALIMDEFFAKMWGSNRKNHTYDRAKLRRSLKKARYIQ